MIKKWLKRLGLAVLVILVLGGSFAAHEWYADKPFFFRAYLDREVLKLALSDPETLTSLGFLESMGIKGHNAELDDVHPDRTEEFFENLRNFRDGIEQYDDEDLDKNQRLALRRDTANAGLRIDVHSGELRVQKATRQSRWRHAWLLHRAPSPPDSTGRQPMKCSAGSPRPAPTCQAVRHGRRTHGT